MSPARADLNAVIAAAQQALPPGRGGRGRRSALYDWMWRHHDALAAEFDQPRAPNWRALAERFAAMGAADGAGRSPTPEIVRKTWWKVRKAKTEARKRTSGPVRTLPVPAPVPAAHPATPVPAGVPTGDSPDAPERKPTYRFGLGVRPKGWLPGSRKAEE